MLKKLTHAGVLGTYPGYLQKRIILTNWISLIIAGGVAAPFTVISLLYFPPITFIPAIGLVVSLSCILFNSLGLVNVSRFIASYVVLILAALYNAFLAKEGEAPFAGIYMIELSFSLIPFLVFDPREKKYLIVSGFFILAVITSFDYTNVWFEIDMDTEIMRTGFLSNVSILIGTVTGLGYVLVLVNQNKLSEEKSEKLLTEMADSQRQATESEHAMKENMVQLQAAQEEEKKRQWTNEGLTQVARLIRDHEDLSELADRLLSYTVKYLEANQGGLFVVNRVEEREVIDLVATYAYDRKKYLEKRIEIGQGLVGQVYLEKKYTYFEQIPDRYVNITSGLGEAPPTALIIMPFQVSGEVEGVLELASFRPLVPHEIDFLEKLGESVAAAIRNTRINEQTRSLLAETQQQAEEMRAAEEEMRQNMEELSATQEEMQRKEQEYLKKIADMDQRLAAYER